MQYAINQINVPKSRKEAKLTPMQEGASVDPREL